MAYVATKNIIVLFLIFVTVLAQLKHSNESINSNISKNYYVYKLNKFSWYGAVIDCLSRDLQLASINSAPEQAAIEKAMKAANVRKEAMWISGNDLHEEGSFVWMRTGKSVTFTNWGKNQPNNAGGHEDCMSINNGGKVFATWYDSRCRLRYFYICEDMPGPVLKYSLRRNNIENAICKIE